MSSDTDMWGSLAEPLKAIHAAFLARHEAEEGRFLPDSPAYQEAGRSELAGEWGSMVERDAAIGVVVPVYAAMDHLHALASLLENPAAMIYAPFTVARGVLDIAASAWHQLEAGLDTQERVRRWMNGELRSRTERLQLFGENDPQAAGLIGETKQRIESILTSAERHGFTVHSPNRQMSVRAAWRRSSR